ncbi:MAG: hypothetical protein EOO81_05115 [Oxalobacteraceae bacterium]|nr:MAG: hypothetical protein EOO81_05115 [Oxalobacteraceae bacterium]
MSEKSEAPDQSLIVMGLVHSTVLRIIIGEMLHNGDPAGFQRRLSAFEAEVHSTLLRGLSRQGEPNPYLVEAVTNYATTLFTDIAAPQK